MRHASLCDFQKWFGAPDAGSIERPIRNLADYYNIYQPDIPASKHDWSSYVQDTLDRIANGSVRINRHADLSDCKERSLSFRGCDNAGTQIDELGIYNVHQDLVLENIKVRKLHIFHSERGAHIFLKDLFVAELLLSHHINCGVRLENCWVENLSIDTQVLEGLSISGGGILNIRTAPPDGGNPFTGTVHIADNVYLPKDAGNNLERPQLYRNMRSHMSRLQNGPMTSRFFALEQSAERRLDSKWSFNRIVSWLYEALSDYGSSPRRTVLWFAGLMLLTFFIVFLSDGAIPNNPEPAFYTGWKHSLLAADASGKASRAAIMTVQSTINPLGIVGGKNVLVASNGWVISWLLFHAFMTAVLLVLFVLALRRRFKMA